MSLSVPCSLAVSRNPCTASAMFRRASTSVSPQLDTSGSGTCAMKVRSSLRIRTVNPRSIAEVLLLGRDLALLQDPVLRELRLGRDLLVGLCRFRFGRHQIFLSALKEHRQERNRPAECGCHQHPDERDVAPVEEGLTAVVRPGVRVRCLDYTPAE